MNIEKEHENIEVDTNINKKSEPKKIASLLGVFLN